MSNHDDTFQKTIKKLEQEVIQGEFNGNVDVRHNPRLSPKDYEESIINIIFTLDGYRRRKFMEEEVDIFKMYRDLIIALYGYYKVTGRWYRIEYPSAELNPLIKRGIALFNDLEFDAAKTLKELVLEIRMDVDDFKKIQKDVIRNLT